jgi:hypothetical protein
VRAPGKKVGKVAVKLDRQITRYRRAEISVELRLDSNGVFHAKYESQWYEAATQSELTEKIRKAAERTIDLEWTRYLIVQYEATAWPEDGDTGRPESTGGYETLSLDDDRGKLARDPEAVKLSHRLRDRVITSIDLHWVICDFSQPYALPEDKRRTARMRRDIDMQRVLPDEDDGDCTYREVIGSPEEQGSDALPVGAVPWTAEREALLRDILKALGRLDARMVALFGGDPDRLARQLDAACANPTRLLTTSEETDDE